MPALRPANFIAMVAHSSSARVGVPHGCKTGTIATVAEVLLVFASYLEVGLGHALAAVLFGIVNWAEVPGILVIVASNAKEGGLDQEEDHALVTEDGNWGVAVVDYVTSTRYCCTASLALGLDMLAAGTLGCKPFVSNQTFLFQGF